MSLPKKLPEVHLKHALFLEDEERFKEAEEEFIKASKPKEAIDMYIHQQDWANASRVGEQYDPASVPDVYVAQARVLVGRKEYQRAEGLFISASKPELALCPTPSPTSPISSRSDREFRRGRCRNLRSPLPQPVLQVR